VAWLGFTFVFVMADLVALSELLVNRGLGLGATLRIGFFLALPAAALSLPFAVLVGVNMALGRLGADRELEAMEACGVSLRRLAWPIGLFSALATLGALVLALAAAPFSHRQLDRIWSSEATQNPTAMLVAGTIQSIGDWRFEALEVSPEGDAFRGVAVWAPELGEMLFAEAGQLDTSADTPALLLSNVEILMAANDPPWRRLHFDRARREVPDLAQARITLSDWSEAATLDDLVARAATAIKPAQAREALSEWHRRFALPLSSLGFGLLALPLSTRRRRHSRSGALVQGLLAAIAYYALLYMGNGLVAGGWVPPALGIWLPDATLGLATIFGVVRMQGPLRVKGGRRLGDDADDEGTGRARMRSFVLVRFIAVDFLDIAGMCFATLLLVIWLGDVLDNLKWFGRYGATPGEIARFYGPRMIVLGTRILPMALLVAAALSMARMQLRGELAGMRACGISGLQIGLPVLIPCLGATLVALVLNTEVMPRAHALSAQIKNQEIKNQGVGPRRGVSWYRIGDRLVVSEVFDPVNGIAAGLQIYDLDSNGLPLARTDALGAQHVDGKTWRLIEPSRIEVVAGRPIEQPAPHQSALGEASDNGRDSDIMTVSEVTTLIETLEQSGYSTTPYRVDRHAKLAWPFACLVLPCIGVLLVLRSRDSPGQSRPVLLATASGVIYLLASGLSVSLGHAGTIPPAVAGWAPVFIAMAGTAALAR
jgi:LPS export ABC transporter permease LptG